MKKGFKKVLAIVLCLTVLMSVQTVAFAAPATTSADFDWGYEFQGLYSVKEGQIISVDIPGAVLAAEDSYIDVENTDIAIKADNPVAGKISLVGVHYGATVLTFEAYNGYHGDDDWWYYDDCETFNYLVVVYDDVDLEYTTGKITDVFVYDTTVKAGEVGTLDYDVELDGDAQYYSVVYIDVCDGGIIEDDGYYETYDRGSIEGIMYFVDINGNYVFDTFTITVKFTPWQWFTYIIGRILDFFFPWRSMIR